MTHIKRWLCRTFGWCMPRPYEPARDPLVARYDRIDRAINHERRQYWRPRDLIEP